MKIDVMGWGRAVKVIIRRECEMGDSPVAILANTTYHTMPSNWQVLNKC